jgi:Ribosomal protein L7/L12 C-terminal domain
MYCPRCKQPVAAERTGHAVRNTLGAAITAGLSLKTERWHCPVCGGPVESERFRKMAVPPPPVEQAEGTASVTLVHSGANKIPALKAYRRLTRASLKEAYAAFEQVPTLIGYFPPAEAERMRAELTAAGCTVEVAVPATDDPGEAGEQSLAGELSALAQLHEAGSLTADEFAAAKARLLSQGGNEGGNSTHNTGPPSTTTGQTESPETLATPD